MAPILIFNLSFFELQPLQQVQIMLNSTLLIYICVIPSLQDDIGSQKTSKIN